MGDEGELECLVGKRVVVERRDQLKCYGGGKGEGGLEYGGGSCAMKVWKGWTR